MNANRIGPYEIVGTLGSGGMSSVSLARAPGGALVVLKRQHHEEDDEALRDEARVGVRLMHPSIVETLDLVEHQGRPVLVVAYVSGATLADLRATGPLPTSVVLRVGRQIADALACIHTAYDEDGTPLSIVHRDVTPANIMLGHDGQARLIDLGIARSVVQRRERTRAGFLKGTLRYLAPEVLKGGESTPWSDLWALGMSLWEAALGRLAVDGTDTSVFAAIVDGKAHELRPGEQMDPRVGHCVGHLLRAAPAHRPPSAAEAAKMFRTFSLAFEDDEVDALAADLVARTVGDEARLGEKAAELVVDRAAATFGGPLGDWRVAPAFSSAGRPAPFPAVAVTRASPDVTEPLRPEEISARVASSPRPADKARPGTAVPAPVDFPSFPSGPPSDGEMEMLRTEVLSVEEARLRAREVAARYRELAEHDSWLVESTIADDRAERAVVTDPQSDENTHDE